MRVYAHYLHQGWPADLLTYLFVSSVDFLAAGDAGPFKKGDVVETYINDPDPHSRFFTQFSDFVACYRLTSIPKVASDTPLVRLEQLEGKLTLGDITVLDGDKFDITPCERR